MNIKIGDLLFEENNSNEIHEVFENNLLKEEKKDETDSFDLNITQLDVVSKRVCKIIAGFFPDPSQYASGKATLETSKSILKTIEKKQVSGGFSLNVFNLKGIKGNPGKTPRVNPADIEIYSKLGFIFFELVSDKKGEVSAVNARGEAIAVIFGTTIPGYKASREILGSNYEATAKFHSKILNLDYSEKEEGEMVTELLHIGLGANLFKLPVVDKTEKIEKLRRAVLTASRGQFDQLETALRESKTSAAKPVNPPSSSKPSEKPAEKPTTNTDDLKASANESYLHKNKLTDLLFEKKSLNKLNTKQKKVLVEKYFNVDYSSLNNYKKRDYYFLTKILYKQETINEGILLEQEDQSLEQAKDIVDRVDQDTIDNVKDEKKQNFLKRALKKAKETIANFRNKKEEQTSEDSEDQSQDSERSIEPAQDAGETIVKLSSEEGVSDESEEDSKADEDSDVEDKSKDLEEFSSTNASEAFFTDRGKDVLAEAAKKAGPVLGSLIFSDSKLQSFIDKNKREAAEFLKNLPDFSKAQRAIANIDNDEEANNLKKDLNKLINSTNKFREDVNKSLEGFDYNNQILTTAQRDNIFKDLKSQNSNEDDKLIQSAADILLINKKIIKAKAVQVHAAYIKILLETFKQANKPSKDLNQAIAIVKSEEGSNPQEVITVQRVQSALNSIGVTKEEAKKFVEPIASTSSISDSKFISNSNLLNTDIYTNSNIVTENLVKPEEANLLKLYNKVVINKDGTYETQNLIDFYNKLENDDSYRILQDKFFDKLRDWYETNNINELSEDKIKIQIESFFTGLTEGNFEGGQMLRRNLGGFGGAIADLGSFLGKILKLSSKLLLTAAIIGAGTYICMGISELTEFFASSGTAQAEAISNLTGFDSTSAAHIKSLTDGSGISGFVQKGIGSLTTTKFATYLATNQTLGAYLANTTAGSALASSWAWLSAPFAAFASGGAIAAAAASFKAVCWLFAGIYSSGAGLLHLATGSFSWGMSLSSYLAIADSASRVTFGIGPGDVLLALGVISSIVSKFRTSSRNKKQDKALGEEGKTLFKLYLTNAITNIPMTDIANAVGVDFTAAKAKYYSEIQVSQDDFNKVITAISDEMNKSDQTFGGINNAGSLAVAKNNLRQTLAPIRNNLGPTTNGILDDVIASLERDLLAAKKDSITDDLIQDHYSRNPIISIVGSALQQRLDYRTITDTDPITMIDSKEKLSKSLKQRLDLEFTSIKKLGSFSSITDSPVNDVIKLIDESERGRKVNQEIKIDEIINDFVKKKVIKKSDINFESIFSDLKSIRGNITANRIKKFQSSGFMSAIQKKEDKLGGSGLGFTKGRYEKYVKEFLTEITQNIASGLEILEDKEVLNKDLQLEYFKNNSTSNFLFECRKSIFIDHVKNSNDSEMLNESIAGILKLGGGLLLGTKAISTLGAMGAQAGFLGLSTASGTAAGAVGGALVTVSSWFTIPTVAALVLATLTAVTLKSAYTVLQKRAYYTNTNPYEDEDFKEAVKEVIVNIINMRVGLCHANVLMMHKQYLEKIGIVISGEDSEMFSQYKEKIDNAKQVRELKKNLNDDGKQFYEEIKSLVYYVKNKNYTRQPTDRGLGFYMTDPMLNDFVDTVCMKKGAPLEEIFVSLQKDSGQSSRGSVNSGFVYKKGLGFILNESDNKEVTINVNTVYNSFKKESYDYLYKKTDFNGQVNAAILDILEPHLSLLEGKGLKKLKSLPRAIKKVLKQKRNWLFVKDNREKFIKETLVDAMYQVTNIEKGKLARIIYKDGDKSKGINIDSRTDKDQISKIKNKVTGESFIHTKGLLMLLEDTSFSLEDYAAKDKSSVTAYIAREKEIIDLTKSYNEALENNNLEGWTWNSLGGDSVEEQTESFMNYVGDHYRALAKANNKTLNDVINAKGGDIPGFEEMSQQEKAETLFNSWQMDSGKNITTEYMETSAPSGDGEMAFKLNFSDEGSTFIDESGAESAASGAESAASGAESAASGAADNLESVTATAREELASAAKSYIEDLETGEQLFSVAELDDPGSYDHIVSLMRNPEFVNTGKTDLVAGMFKLKNGNYEQIYLSNGKGGWTRLVTKPDGTFVELERINSDNFERIGDALKSAERLNPGGDEANAVYELVHTTKKIDTAQTFDPWSSESTYDYMENNPELIAKLGDGPEITTLQDVPSEIIGPQGIARKYDLSDTTGGAAEKIQTTTAKLEGYNPEVYAWYSQPLPSQGIDDFRRVACVNDSAPDVISNITNPVSTDSAIDAVINSDQLAQDTLDLAAADQADIDADAAGVDTLSDRDQLAFDDELRDLGPEDGPGGDGTGAEAPVDKEISGFDSVGGKDGGAPIPSVSKPDDIFGFTGEEINLVVSDVALTLLGTKLLDFFTSAPMEGKTIVPLVRNIDWARIPVEGLSAGIASYLIRNKDRWAEKNITITGNLPEGVNKLKQQLSKDFGDSPALAGELSVLSKRAANRLHDKLTAGMSKKKAAKFKITDKDIERAIKKDLRQTLYSYHKGYNTGLYQRIEDNVNDNLLKRKRKEARGNVRGKTAAGLTLLGVGGALVGGALTVTGLGASLGIPLMVAGGGVYSNRAGTFEEDQMASGDEREKELQRQIDKLTDRDTTKLTKVIIDIAKEAKGLDENFNFYGNLILESEFLHKTSLSNLLFEDDKNLRKSSSIGYPVSKVKDYLKSAAVMVYDNELTPGSEVYEKAEEFTISTICAILRSTCDITVTGIEKYNKPQVVAAKAETYANASVNIEAPVGQQAVPTMAALTADAAVPQMNQPITPQQFAAVLNNSGGENAKLFTRFMMYHMLLQQTGGDSDRAMKQLGDFLQAMGEGKLTAKEAFDTAEEIISDNSPEELTQGSEASKDTDGSSSSSSSAPKTNTFAQALASAVQNMNDSLPQINQDDVEKIFNGFSNISQIINNQAVNGILELTARGRSVFPATSTRRTTNDESQMTSFVEQCLLGRIKITDQPVKYKKSQKALSNAFMYVLINSANDGIISLDQNRINNLITGDKPGIGSFPGRSESQRRRDFEALLTGIGARADAEEKSILQVYFVNKILNKKLGTKLKTSTNFTHMLAGDIHKLLKPIKKFLKDIKVESRVSRKPVIDNRVKRRREVLSEEYLMGNLSSLLFEESLVVESKSSKSKEISDSNINLRREWLKIWDI